MPAFRRLHDDVNSLFVPAPEAPTDMAQLWSVERAPHEAVDRSEEQGADEQCDEEDEQNLGTGTDEAFQRPGQIRVVGDMANDAAHGAALVLARALPVPRQRTRCRECVQTGVHGQLLPSLLVSPTPSGRQGTSASRPTTRCCG